MHEEGTGPVGELLRRAGLAELSPGARRGAVLVGAALLLIALWRYAPGSLGLSAGADPTVVEASEPATVAASPSASRASTSPAEVVVHLAGAVRRPGVYHLPSGSRVCDAVALSGGLLGTAAASAVNLARTLTDGEQIVVPTQEEAAAGQAGGAGAPEVIGGAPAGGAGSGGSDAGGGMVDINTAGVSELDTLPGVGPATAQKIVDDRTANGPFRTAEDLMRVPGIGPKKFEQLAQRVTAR